MQSYVWFKLEFSQICFNIGKGYRQGDPISPYLFNMCVEAMGIMIRQNRHIKGIHIQRDFCLFQYAEDTIMFLDGTEKQFKISFRSSLSIFKIFRVKIKLRKKPRPYGYGQSKETRIFYALVLKYNRQLGFNV